MQITPSLKMNPKVFETNYQGILVPDLENGENREYFLSLFEIWNPFILQKGSELLDLLEAEYYGLKPSEEETILSKYFGVYFPLFEWVEWGRAYQISLPKQFEDRLLKIISPSPFYDRHLPIDFDSYRRSKVEIPYPYYESFGGILLKNHR